MLLTNHLMLHLHISMVIVLATTKIAAAAPGDLLFKLTAPDPQPGAGFGKVVTAADGYIVVGEPDRHVNNTAFVGQAYIFDARTGALRFTLEEPEPINRSTFGTAVAIGDGSVYIGGGAAGDRGRVYVFDPATGGLRFQIEGPNGGADAFAAALAYEDGDLLVAAPSFTVPGEPFPVGQAYLYDAQTGQLDRTIPNPEPRGTDGFGQGLAIFADKAAVGAILDDLPDDPTPYGENPGRVWVFNRESGNVAFTLENPNPESQLADWFGWSVAANDQIIVVGAREDGTSGVDGSGTVYVFNSTDGTLLHTLFSPQSESNGEFGRSVAITPVGDILVGAWGTSVNGIEGAGHAYLFDGETGNLLLDLPNPEPTEFSLFGWSVAAVDERLLIGAVNADAGALPSTGSVYVFASIPEPSGGSLVTTIFILATPFRRRLR